MIRFFWKFRFVNLILILILSFFCLFKFSTFKVFFDSERIIELVNVEKDVIEESIDDSNLLLIALKFDEEISFLNVKQIDSILVKLVQSNYVKSIKSVFNQKVLLKESLIPIPFDLLKFETKDDFMTSIRRIKANGSHLIAPDLKSLIFVVKCKNLNSEEDKVIFLNFLDRYFSSVNCIDFSITGQIKSEIYMKSSIINELKLFISISALICCLLLFFFFRSYKLVLVALFSIIFSIIFSFSLSNFLFGGIELVMIIIPAIIFIINISDYMHLLNIDYQFKNKYKLFREQLINIGRPVFLTSLTTALGFLSFTFGSFEPLMRFGLVTTLSIFICLFIIVTFFAFVIDYKVSLSNKHILTNANIYFFIDLVSPYKKIIFLIFIIFSLIGISQITINNYLTDELNKNSELYKEINFIEENFGGIKPLSFSLSKIQKDDVKNFTDFLDSNQITVDLSLPTKENILIKSRIRDIGTSDSQILYSKINNYVDNKMYDVSVGGVGYLFDKISNQLTREVLIGLVFAIFLIGFIFVSINNFNYRYLPVSLAPNLIPLLSCLGIFSLFGFYLSLSNAFILAIVFGLIVDDSVHIISAYSLSRKAKKSVEESLRHCREKTYRAVFKTTIVIILSLLPLLFSEFKSISQLASITIISALIALVFDILFLPSILKKYIH